MRYITRLVLIAGAVISTVISQSHSVLAQDAGEVPNPSVAFYQCLSGAIADTGYPTYAIQSCSHYLFLAIASDTTTRHVDFYSFANAGNDSLDSALAGGWAPQPDTSATIGADYYISSAVSGSAGGYTLTVYLKDAAARTVIASGSAAFSAADTTSVKTASETAASGILPLIAKITAYQTQERNASTDLSLDPQVEIVLPNLLAGLNQNVDVAIRTVDIDGYPLKNRHVKLGASRGSFASSEVQTDANGQATVAYNSGSGSGVAVLSASMDSSLTVTGDTLSAEKQSYLIVGNVPLNDSTQYYTDTIYELDFTLRVKVAGFTDKSATDVGMLSWSQSDWAEVYSAYGSVPGHGMYSSLANTFVFNADTGAVWGRMFKTKSKHDIAMYDADPCQDYDLMESMTYNGKVDQVRILKNSPGYLSYTPSASPGQKYEFTYEVPFVYQGSDDSWGEPSGNTDSQGNCQRGDASSHLYYVNQPYAVSGDHYDSDPGASVVKSGDDYFISYSNVDVTEDTTTSLTGTVYQAIVTQYTATLRPIQKITSVHGFSGAGQPAKFGLDQNYPDPFNPTTVIGYHLSAAGNVILKVYDVLGREVASLVSRRQAPGNYSVTFDAGRLPSGVYFYRLTAGAFSSVRKLIVLK